MQTYKRRRSRNIGRRLMDIILKVAIIVLCAILILSGMILYNISEQLFEISKLFEDIREMIDQAKINIYIN